LASGYKVSQLTAVLADPEDIPGIGPVTATALAATVGLVPPQHSSGSKERQGGISKAGVTAICAGCW
jgi:transposase